MMRIKSVTSLLVICISFPVFLTGISSCSAFAPISSNPSYSFTTTKKGFSSTSSSITTKTTTATTTKHNLMVDSFIDIATNAASVMAPAASNAIDTASSSSSMMMSFTDQGQNAAGIFFQASLIPYCLFLYFIGFRGNRIPEITNFGFQAVLIFVFTTIPSGIITKSVYGASLANVDWLHGTDELLLTLANICIVLGLKEWSTNPSAPENKDSYLNAGRVAIFTAFAGFAVAVALGPSQLGFEEHSAFLLGAGDLSSNVATISLPWVSHEEPINALSIPTWAIHFSSVFEYVIAMNLVWNFAKVTNNEKWKGLAWGMLPLHASGVCACTYHIFYNAPALQYVVTLQAFTTLLGNITCMIAAYRIAKSNGWSIEDALNFLPASKTSPAGLTIEGIATSPLQTPEEYDPNTTKILFAQLSLLVLFASYLTKYGELGIDIPFSPSVPISASMIIGFPALTATYFYTKGKDGGETTSGLVE